MAVEIEKSENTQQVEFEVSGPGNVNRVFIATGELPMHIIDTEGIEKKETVRYKLDLELTEDQFKRAIAYVCPLSVANIVDPIQTQKQISFCLVEAADADRDDETGKVALRVDTSVFNANLRRLGYQVTVLSKM